MSIKNFDLAMPDNLPAKNNEKLINPIVLSMLNKEIEDLKQTAHEKSKEIQYLGTSNANLMEEINFRVSEIKNLSNLNMSLKKELEMAKIGFPINLSQQNCEHIIAELTKTLETYRNRLVTLIASIRSDDKAQVEETNGVIENLTQEMQTYSLLLIKTQIALDHKEKETMALRYEVEQINLAEKDSMSNHVKKKIEDFEILIKEKDKLIKDLVIDKRSLTKELEDYKKRAETTENSFEKDKIELSLMKEHAERLMGEKKDVLTEFDKYRNNNDKIKKDDKESIRTLEFELRCLKGSNKNNGQIFSTLDDSIEEDAKQAEIDL